MPFMDKIKQFVAPMDDDNADYIEADETEYVETQQPVRQAAASKPVYENNNQSLSAPLDQKTKMVLFEPRSYEAARDAAVRMKEGRAVVVNLHKLDHSNGTRVTDFLTGVAFALDGKVQKIGERVLLCYPDEIGVAGSIKFGKDEDESED